ncbi:Bax inhibitor-1/YccA family protein [Glycomyces sp. MUSA5-2]|uniref:Bax inhibitor-1/YccA family protein n=1 Tax=Glycomyces sp. MUSA5-2 TaxID=2053002 RepID=UPI00300B1AE8
MVKTQYGEQQHMGAAYGPYGQMTQAPPAQTMTIDDVIVRTVALVGATFVAALVTFGMVGSGDASSVGTAGMLMALGGVVGIVVVIFSMFKPVTNPFVAFAYGIGQGLVLGGLSAIMEAQIPGIVVNALVATILVFFGMLALYKFRILKNSPMFTKVIVGAGFGIAGLLLVNFVASLFSVNLGLFAAPGGDPTTLQWVIAIALTLWAAFSFILDFDMIEWSANNGAPKKYAWAGAFGLTAGLIFLYWNLLRLLSYFQGE